MLKAIRVSVLLLSLTGAARAGEVIVPPAPEPVKPSTAQEPSVNYDDDSTSVDDVSEEIGIFVQIAIELLVSALP